MNSENFKELTKNYSDNTKIFLSNFTEDYSVTHPLEARTACYLIADSLFCDYGKKQTVTLKELRSLNNQIIDIDVEDGFVFRPLDKILNVDNYLILLTK